MSICSHSSFLVSSCSDVYHLKEVCLNLQEARKLVEDKLLEVKGMISFTFNMPLQRCYVRVRQDIQPEDLCQAVSATGSFFPQQVVKNENGEEVSVCACILPVGLTLCDVLGRVFVL